MKKINRKAKRSIYISITILVISLVVFVFAFKYNNEKTNSVDTQIANKYGAEIYKLENERKELENKINQLESSKPVDLPITTILVNANSNEIISVLNENSLDYIELSNIDYDFDDSGETDYLIYADNDIDKINEIITFHNIVGIFVPSYIEIGFDSSLITTPYIYVPNSNDYIDINSKYHISYIQSNKNNSMSIYSDLINSNRNACIYINESGDSLDNCIQTINYFVESKMTKVNNSRFEEDDMNEDSINLINEYNNRINEINKEIEELRK